MHILVLILTISIITGCEKTNLKLYKNTKCKHQLEIPYILNTPIIDGILDKELSDLKPQKFKYIWQFDNPKTDTVNVSYRMAYTQKYLYLYLETDVDSISYHRRGYLWGDGYKLLLGIPQKDSLTNEYYELSFSPTLEKEYEWDKQRIINYNFGQVTKKLSRYTQSQEKKQKEKSGFETLIYWDDIKPYHPWMMNKIGYNIYFAKGIEHKKYGYITNGYSLVKDEGIWDEEIPKRNYNLLSFEHPKINQEAIILTQPKKQNLLSDEPIIVKFSSIGKQRKEIPIGIQIKDKNQKIIYRKKINHLVKPQLKSSEYKLIIDSLSNGKYFLEILDKQQITTHELSILPNIPYKRLEKEIKQNPHQLSKNIINTLLFKLQELKSNHDNLKYYEIGLTLIEQWNEFNADFQLIKKGKNPYQEIKSPHRRAFRSLYDNTLQPYTINFPKNYNSKKKYPLLVFLHGSGQDEQNLLNQKRSNGDFIELAPFARDKFRAYAEDYSQKDILEAIQDVKKYFNIDENNIIIGGFSMGGYGALLTFYKQPALYRGVAIFAGHPNLANEWLDGNYPNFLEDEYLKEFKNIPVFIYHGKKDAGLDVKLIEKMSEKLIQNGAKVTKSIVENKGHEYQDEKTNNNYFNWLNEVIKE